MRSSRRSARLRALLIAALLAATAAGPVAAQSEVLTVHGVTRIVTDSDTCGTRLEVGFRAEIGDLPLSNGHLDPASISGQTLLVDGSPALSYSVHTDFGVAPFYFATLELGLTTPGVHELIVRGGQAGVHWRAFDHADPEHPYIAHLTGDYRLAFTVPPCGAALPVVFSSFDPPVDDPPILNLVRRGATVPIRFTAARGENPITDPHDFAVTVSRARCTRLDPTDTIERLVPRTGAGELFHDPVTGDFVYRWTAVSGRHPCWDVTFTHVSGGSVTAKFRLWGGA